MTGRPPRRLARWPASALLLAFVAAIAGPPVSAQDDAAVERLTREVEALKQGQALIRQQLDELKKLLQARPAARARRSVAEDLASVELDLSGDPVKGASTARVVMMEFSDYECPYCARHNQQVLPRLERDYIQAGKIRYVFRDFPLERIHKQAFRAAQAANCAGEQGRYWQMHDRLFANRRAIEPLAGHAQAAGVADVPAFEQCLASGRHAAEVRADMTEGRKLGVNSTPTFVLGYSDDEGKVSAVRIVRGALAFERLQQEIERLLAEPGQS